MYLLVAKISNLFQLYSNGPFSNLIFIQKHFNFLL